ncbi:MAG: 5-(carboxyamino)imidazole ribonucleotide synthase [Spirochaetes bacterium GWF1_60_12]|nr:MAG: 5-(carboxyamino)imidazole ribonucleotide synthase [Spirochaetes bacterium GWF1_60_12]
MKKIGIIGSGQLGRMTIEEARKLLCHIEVLSPEYPAPAAELADETIVGSLMDYDAVMELADRVDVLSYEIEHVNIEALRAVERSGKPVIPPAEILALIQDKASQKRVMDQAGVPTAGWCLPGAEAAEGRSTGSGQAVAGAVGLGGFPLVQKSRRGGYDGRGVAVLRSSDDLRPAAEGGRLLAVPSFLERYVDFSKELAVMVALDGQGKLATWPCVEMVFDERVNLCDSVLMPARVSAAVAVEAERVAKQMVEALAAAARLVAQRDGLDITVAGVFAVELFLDKAGRVLVNETAPRPHNSGHLTCEACITSQFSQYYRILSGYPLGATTQVMPAMMLNLLGELDADGEPVYDGLALALAVPGVSVHLYGKRLVKPFRKMGHLTALGATIEEAISRANQARAAIKVRSKK